MLNRRGEALLHKGSARNVGSAHRLRFLGQPVWLINSDVTSAYLYFGCIAAAAHIIRPGELDERIPAPEQIRIGIIVGVLAALGLAIVYAPDIMTLVHGLPIRGDAVRRAVG